MPCYTYYAVFSVVIVCAGENEGRSWEKTADIGGKQTIVTLFFIGSNKSVNHLHCALLYYAMFSIVIARAVKNERQLWERTSDIGGKQSFVILFFYWKKQYLESVALIVHSVILFSPVVIMCADWSSEKASWSTGKHSIFSSFVDKDNFSLDVV